MKVFATFLCSLVLLLAVPAHANGTADDGPLPASSAANVPAAVASAPEPVAIASVAAPAPPAAALLPSKVPQITHFLVPGYPEIAWQSNIQGKVTLKILVFKDGRFDFAGEPQGKPVLVAAAKENLCSWNFAHTDSAEPLPLTVQFEYRIDKVRTSAQLNAQATYDLPGRVTVVAPAYAPSCLCIKKKSRWHIFGK